MNHIRVLLFIIVAASLTGCASAYRAGDTPDDLYYAPQPETHARGAAYLQNDNSQNRYRPSDSRTYQGSGYYDYAEDRYLRMLAGNRYRWSYFDDYYYGLGSGFAHGYGFGGYGNYGFGGYGGFGSPYHSLGWYNNPWGYTSFNNYWQWNNYYNPYYSHSVVINPKTNPATYNNLRNFRPSTYTNNNYYRNSVNTPANLNKGNNRYTNPNYRNNNNQRAVRESSTIPGQQRYNNNNSNSRPERTYTPPSNNRTVTPSAPSSAPSRSGGVSRPSRND